MAGEAFEMQRTFHHVFIYELITLGNLQPKQTWANQIY